MTKRRIIANTETFSLKKANIYFSLNDLSKVDSFKYLEKKTMEKWFQ